MHITLKLQDLLKKRIKRLYNLSHLVDDHQRNWDTLLPFALWSYRTSISLTTPETPYFLLFGYHPRLPVTLLQDDKPITYASLQQYGGELSAKIRLLHELVQRELTSAAEKQENIIM